MGADHIMDPDGDSLLTLRNPNAQLAVASTVPFDKSVTFLVSSHYLILASVMSKAMLSGQWYESSKKTDGLFHIDAQDWDIEAFSLVLNAIHGQTQHIPQEIQNVELLAKDFPDR
jgi:hypothetical protein